MRVARLTPPAFIVPMQPTSGPISERDEWLYELKLDGFRCIAVKRGSKVVLYSRDRHDLTPRGGSDLPLAQLSRSQMQFTVVCHGSDPLGLREKLEQFANEQWLPTHVTREEAAAIVMDQFRRTVAHTMELLELTAD